MVLNGREREALRLGLRGWRRLSIAAVERHVARSDRDSPIERMVRSLRMVVRSLSARMQSSQQGAMSVAVLSLAN